MGVKWLWLTGLFLFFLTGCGQPSIEQFLEENYSFVDVVKSNANASDYARVYEAKGKDLSKVVAELETNVPPSTISDVKEGQRVLVYPEHFVFVSNDENNHSLIELSSKGFVRDNYSPDFFDGMLAMWILDEVLDVDDWGKQQRKRCQDSYNRYGESGRCYQSYGSSGGTYRGPMSKPNFRGYSPSVRGGGPGTGK